ncbi:putative E3 ubiquitin-protein ligase RHA2A [Abeliophyllum distichum]|uniref:RING-type E3 ubiquitin transferase n=1 Tax=Abeliophyllum distichum TaxID=126358 RepID=A0ABD1SBR6_9LAMI
MVFKKLILSICTFFSLRRKYCIKPQIADSNINQEKLIKERVGFGFDKSDVEGTRTLCCVCLSSLSRGDKRVLPCLHEFHRICVNRWLNGCCKTCPVCRFPVDEDEGKRLEREELTDEMVIWFSSFHVAGF